jgi:hypothetical protein
MHLKSIRSRLQEDKVIAKEEEGGSVGGGEVSVPPSTPSPDEDISKPTTPKPDGILSTSDVLGKCDHKHDGFFGPGCMHRPFAVFSYPVSRIKRKKRKYIKVLDLTESDDFERFNGIANHFIDDTINDVNGNILNLIDGDLNVAYDPNYGFDGEKSDWVSALEEPKRECPKTLTVALNLPAIYNFLDENSLENDSEEIGCQIRASILHEVGHGLVRYFGESGTYDFELTEDEEESLVSEYVKCKMGKYTGVKDSKLQGFIDEMFRGQVNESRKSGKINVVSRNRFITKKNCGKFDDSIPGFSFDASDGIIDKIEGPYTVDFTNRGYGCVVPKDLHSDAIFFRPSSSDVMTVFGSKGKTPPLTLLLKAYGNNHPNVAGKPLFPKYSDVYAPTVLEDGTEKELFVFQGRNTCEHIFESGKLVIRDMDDENVLKVTAESLDGFLGRLYRDDSVLLYGNGNLGKSLSGFLKNLT